MEQMKLHFNYQDIFRAPRLALSGKKILAFTIALLVGYVNYFILTYFAFALGGYSFSETFTHYGIYPCLIGNTAPWYAFVVYWIAVVVLALSIHFGCTAVSRITYKQLKGDEFFSSGDAWKFVLKHWHPVIFTPVTFIFILVFFIGFAFLFALLGKIPFLGEFLFVIPYLLYFFGSVFTIYTGIVFLVSFIYTPAIIGAYEEDTMGTVFNSYSITWSQPWRILIYHTILLPIAALAGLIFSKAWMAGYHLINYVFGCEWLMGSKLDNIVAYASQIICPADLFGNCLLHIGCPCCAIASNSCALINNTNLASISGTETAAGVILSIFFFLLLLSAVSYVLSIFSVGETLMFVIFKKRSDDDNILERKDEDEVEEDKNVDNETEQNKDDHNGDNEVLPNTESEAESGSEN